MSALTDPVLRGKKDHTQDYLQDFNIIGVGEEVRQRDNGEIIQAELFICDVKEVDRIETDHDEGKAGGNVAFWSILFYTIKNWSLIAKSCMNSL